MKISFFSTCFSKRKSKFNQILNKVWKPDKRSPRDDSEVTWQREEMEVDECIAIDEVHQWLVDDCFRWNESMDWTTKEER